MANEITMTMKLGNEMGVSFNGDRDDIIRIIKACGFIKSEAKCADEDKHDRIGYKMIIKLSDGRFFNITAQDVDMDKRRVMYMFDDCVDSRPMNSSRTNAGGYGKSELRAWLNSNFYQSLPEIIRERIDGDIFIPTYGMIFGHNEYYSYFEPDGDEQLPLMKSRTNRIADYNNEMAWYWLQNKRKESSTGFAVVVSYGYAHYGNASFSRGVRPAFWLTF